MLLGWDDIESIDLTWRNSKYPQSCKKNKEKR